MLGWGRFTNQPKPVVVSIVQEFYANKKETEGYVVQVREKAVSYDKASINAYYHIPDTGDDEFTEYIRDEIDLEESKDEIIQQPKGMIDQHTIDRFQQWEGGIADLSGARFTLLDADAAGTSAPPPSTSALLQSLMDYLVAEVREICRDTAELRKGQSVLQ